MYSLPLRRGLVLYAAQTARGFIQAAGAWRNHNWAACRGLFAGALRDCGAVIAAVLPAEPPDAAAR